MAANKYDPWTYIKDRRPPEYEAVIFLCIYPNGNEVHAVGYRVGRKYEIEWTDDHPEPADIMFWMAFHEAPFGKMRVDTTRARSRHDRGLRP